MRYYFVETYGDDGDYEYYVFVDDPAEIEQALKDYRDEETLTVTIHKTYGPFLAINKAVLSGKSPH